MISGTEAFDSVLAAVGPLPDRPGFSELEANSDPQAFGSRTATFGRGADRVRLTFDGKERWFVLEAADGPGQARVTMWIDLTLQRFDPTRADTQWPAEVVEDPRDALAAHLEPPAG